MILKPGAGALSQSPHDEFLGLCAVSTSGQLTAEERKRLQQHLRICPSCREAMQQFDAVVRKTIPALAPDPKQVEFDPLWSQEQAETALFERLTHEEQSGAIHAGSDGDSVSEAVATVTRSASQATWRNVWVLCAAGILLCIALGVSAFQVGIRLGVKSAVVRPIAGRRDSAVLQERVSDAGHEREILSSQMAERDREVSSLRCELGRQSSEMRRMRLVKARLEAELQTGQTDKQDILQRQSELTQKLEAAETKTQGLQQKLEVLGRQSSEDKQRANALEAKVVDLTRLLRDREAGISQAQELLAHDRDIRDLMGARDLYVAEVYDVEGTGETKKPYGRVFYTKGKSLIFYAYDLDKQPGVKNASTFQAWGRRGPEWQEALNLGVFYVDNASKRRWILRFDDPKALAQIDAVFVTVEPNGGSQRPSKKPLLFDYMHIDPNHP
jgi:hypothetical protein